MIELNEVTFQYRNSQVPNLIDISFKLEEGEVMAVVGPSGGGKSTLLRVIAGLESPKSGCIRIEDVEVLSKNHEVAPQKRGVGMVFQDYALFPHLTVEKNILYGIDDLTHGERKVRVKEVMALVELDGYGKRYPHELSGGQQQRIALARAIAPRPKVLLLDEPFSNLDTHLLTKVRDDLFRIIRHEGITTIMVTHNPKDAEQAADRTMRIVAGVIESMA